MKAEVVHKIRETEEVSVKLSLKLDGEGRSSIKTGLPFLDHLLTTLAKHSLIDLSLEARGDLEHHLVEDVAISLGEALDEALGERKGIKRFGHALVPMDEALAQCSIDLVRRPYCVAELRLKGERVEGMASEDVEHLLPSLASSARICIHVTVQYGENDHHKAEAAFKALAIALREALEPYGKGSRIPSLKGRMD